jgi:glycine cleavage system H protein
MIPANMKYTKEHEWALVEGNVVTIGVTHHAAKELGDIVYLELPKVGTALTAHQPLGVVESVKAVSDIYSPITGKVVGTNDALTAAPQGINEDPYGKAWMLKIEMSKKEELNELMDAKAYEELLKKTAK